MLNTEKATNIQKIKITYVNAIFKRQLSPVTSGKEFKQSSFMLISSTQEWLSPHKETSGNVW